MTDLIQLTDVEIAAVSGGSQSISISASQYNSSSVSQSASASNYGNVSATASYGALAAAAGAESSNTAVVSQANVIAALNSVKVRRYW